MNLNISVGTAIVICMLLYLADKHGKLKIVLQFAAVGLIGLLAWNWLAPKYDEWKIARYSEEHVRMKEQLIHKYGVVAESSAPEVAVSLCSDPVFRKLTNGERDEVVGTVTDYYYQSAQQIPACTN